MRRLFTLLALSGMFVTPALAREHVARDTAKSASVAADTKPTGGDEAKPAPGDAPKPAEKPMKKSKRSSKKTESTSTEKPVEGTPAK